MNKKRVLEMVMAVILLVGVLAVSQRGALAVSNLTSTMQKQVVVIDAGHGGRDPGKVGVNGELEKEINLNIALKLKESLETQGITVVMIREKDEGLYDEDTQNKKVQDMQRRVEIIDQVSPALVVSIHQNSYNDASVSGAQVFYYQHSKEGKVLADSIQNLLNTDIGMKKVKQPKANESYYMLKKTTSPTVIVECGFLSNAEEAMRLTEADYQELLAEVIMRGIMSYLGENK